VNSRTERRVVAGPAGDLVCVLDHPPEGSGSRGLALLCHPHPQHGGTLDNKVVATLARAFVQAGWRAARFNFRGVGGSAGHWDHGRGEIDDALAVARALREPDEPLAIGGFSFGGYVASHAAAALHPSELVLVGPATRSFDVAPVPAHTLVVHGEADEVVPLQATLDWARRQSLPVVVVPGGDHFFHGRLTLLKFLVLRHLGAPTVEPPSPASVSR
jgi:alpha/beta superfamily hydrolase